MDAHCCWLILLGSLIVKDVVHTAGDNPPFKCYVCSVTSVRYRLDSSNPCITNATSLYPQECAPTQKYCQVQKTVRHDQIIGLERKCSDSYQLGCIRYAFARWKVVCTVSCNQSECNIHGGVPRSKSDYLLIMAMLFFHILICSGSDIIVHRFDSK